MLTTKLFIVELAGRPLIHGASKEIPGSTPPLGGERTSAGLGGYVWGDMTRIPYTVVECIVVGREFGKESHPSTKSGNYGSSDFTIIRGVRWSRDFFEILTMNLFIVKLHSKTGGGGGFCPATHPTLKATSIVVNFIVKQYGI